MDYDEIKKSIVNEFALIAHKRFDELTESELKNFLIWSENTEIAALLPLGEAGRKLFKENPQLEILLLKSPVEHFSKWYKKAGKKRVFQRKQYINEVINIYKNYIENQCISREAEFIRLGLIEEYKKSIKAFEEIKLEKEIPIDERNRHKEQQNEMGKVKKEATHREIVLLNFFKSDAGYESRKEKKDHQQEGGQNRVKAYYSLSQQTRSKTNPYRTATQKEIENIIPALVAFPIAKKLAEEKLKSLQ
jgi:hypothetical protein